MTNVLDPKYLKFRGESLIEMYNWKRERIYKFLHESCTTEPLKLLYKQFLSLCPLDKPVPDGWKVEHNYQPVNKKGNPDSKAYGPDQHIFRMPTRDPRPIFSKFDVNPNDDWTHTNTMSIPGSETTLASPRYWNHYDLLGLILSVLQPELDGADKDRFFLPLTAVYGRWCAQIGGNRATTEEKDKGKRGVGAVPAVFQCTWIKGKEDKVYFALGSSLAGFDWNNEEQVGKWKIRLRHTRFDLLKGWNYIDKAGEKWDYWWSPTLEENAIAGTHFGNCGETYPFLHVFDSWTKNSRGKAHGLALSSKFLGDNVLKLNYSPKAMHQPADDDETSCKFIIPPCKNCRYLLQKADAVDAQFIYPPIQST
ncbi:uncharacterized protein FPRO_15659 [Fusarium proliferatum ET1]|uniref:Uncharacterized protein n=1 Tax=Fusarium proliferatum (strain ET1) TaxID=1227346 RepID=A0A1L7VYV5_FUSPR|nr:uncharacterized protein FPRO_15659 [Fusarium proliferatum ET1]CZR45166.1 uncharacterized protein FPRO_15659 [Fusarium proliferatum ET1]